MSYILGALKKAEKDRKRDDSLDLDNWDHEDWSRPKETSSYSNTILYAVLSTLMLVLILFAWLAYKVLIMPQQSVAPYSQVSDSMETEYPVRAGVVDAGSEDVIPVYVEPEKTEIPLGVAGERPPPSVEPEKGTSKSHIVSSSEKPIERAKPEVKRVVAPPIRPALPRFSGHIYFPNNNRFSRVFSGPNSYREGDEIEGYLIERIGEGVAVLSFSGQEYRVKLAN